MYKPLVSVITPSYNQGRFIRETIESVLAQDYDNIEYIIIDGGSTDNTLEIVKEYGDRIKFISEKDNGQSDAINKGFKMAHGEIVSWLNSDDIYEKKCISKVVMEFNKNKNLALVYGDGYILDSKSIRKAVFEHTQEFDLWKLTNFWDYIMQPSAFFRMEHLQKVGYLDDKLNYCMDWDLWIKLSNVGEVKYIHDFLACSREYATTKTSTGGKRRLSEIEKLLQKYSGKSRPLGVYSYKASTLFMSFSGGGVISKVLGLYLGVVHKILMYFFPKKDKDGWIPYKYEFCVPAYCKEYLLKVEDKGFSSINKVMIQIDNAKPREYDLACNYIKIILPPNNKMHTISLKFPRCWRRTKKVIRIVSDTTDA